MKQKRFLGGVYMIQNTLNSKIYIGSSCNVITRMRNHMDRPANENLKSDLLIHGIEKFSFSVLEFIPLKVDEAIKDFYNRLREREQYFIDTILLAKSNKNFFAKNAYNEHYLSTSPMGISRSESSRIKMSEWQKGRILPRSSVEKATQHRKVSYENKILEKYGSLSNYQQILRDKKNEGRRKNISEYKIKTGLPICCYNEDGVFIRKFNSQSEAHLEFPTIALGGISRAIKNMCLCYKMYWTIYDDTSINGIVIKKKIYSLKDHLGIEISEFKSVLSMAKYIGCHHGTILSYLKIGDTFKLLLGKYQIDVYEK